MKALGLTAKDCKYIQQELNDTSLTFPEIAARIEKEVFCKRREPKPLPPFKAFEVYKRIDNGISVTEYSFGVHGGRTAAQARAAAATDRDGVDNPWIGLRSRRVYGSAADKAIDRAEDQANIYWQDTQLFARLTAAAEVFNAAFPVGTVVELTGSYWGQHQQLDNVTVTRTPAWVTCGLALLVSVEGIAGGVDFTRVVPLEEPHRIL